MDRRSVLSSLRYCESISLMSIIMVLVSTFPIALSGIDFGKRFLSLSLHNTVYRHPMIFELTQRRH